jgi:amino acid permease
MVGMLVAYNDPLLLQSMGLLRLDLAFLVLTVIQRYWDCCSISLRHCHQSCWREKYDHQVPIPCCQAENCLYRLVLPHIINGAIFSSAFSTRNSLVFSASRVLHGLAVRGQMPQFLTYCTKNGLPLYAVIVSVSALTIMLRFHVPQYSSRVASRFSLS